MFDSESISQKQHPCGRPFPPDLDPFAPIPSSTILFTLDSELIEHVEEVVAFGFLSFYTTLLAFYNREWPLDGHKNKIKQ